jgi:hypothetical protein
MIAFWESLSLLVFDLLLGWLLWLPRDASVILLGLLSAVLAVGIRRLVCDRQVVELIRRDERVLRRLIREARRAGDRASLTRHRRVRAAVARLRFSQEVRSLAVMILPLLALVPWASARMEFLPPRGDESVELVAWLPASSVGEAVHLVPAAGLEAPDGWIRAITPSQREGQTRGRAEWRVRAASGASPYRLTLRFRDRSLEHGMLVGQSTYAAPVIIHGEDIATELRLRRYVPLGISRIGNLGVPPWVIAYLVVTLTMALVLNRLMRKSELRNAESGQHERGGLG